MARRAGESGVNGKEGDGPVDLAAALQAKVVTLPSGNSLPAEAPDELLAALRGALS